MVEENRPSDWEQPISENAKSEPTRWDEPEVVQPERAPQPSSPTPGARVVMDFPDAIRKVIQGKRITKLEWQDRDYYGLIKDGVLKIHKGGDPEGVFYAWIINDGDLLGSDWIVLS